jgi:hypothetical protein
MAVQIPISASPAGAVDAIKAIQDAITRAGQAGRQFSQLDLSHPELAGMANDIGQLAGRFQDLARIGRGSTAAAFRAVNRAGGGGDPADFLAWQSNLSRVFPDPAQMAQHRAAVLGYATRGTQWAPTGGGGGTGPPGPGPAPAPPAPGGGGGGGGMLASIGSAAMGFMGASLAMAGISTVKQVLSESIGKAQEEAGTGDDLYRHTDGAQSFIELRDAVMASTKALGVNAQEAERLSLMWARVTGETGADAITANVRMGVGLGRSFGMDPGTATAGLAQASVMGMDPAKFAILVGEAAGKGGRSADETMPALLRLAEASTKALVTHSNELETASMLAGLNAMGLPGLRGANAEAVMNTLGTSIGQGGNAGIASAALSFAVGRRQGVTDPYDLKMLQEGGLFGNAKADLGYGSSETNLSARLAELQRQYAGAPQNRLLNAMENDLGINMRQGRELLRYKPSDLSSTFTALQDAHVNLKDMNPTAIGDAVRIANADTGGLGDIRDQMLKRHGLGELSPSDQKTLTDAGPDSLRNVLLTMSARYGQSETDGSKTRDAQAELSNAMTKVGRDLLPPLNDLKDGVGKLGGELADLGSIITDVYRAGKGDPVAQQNLTYGKGPEGDRRARGDRNNNPLNLEYSSGDGSISSDGRFGKFASPEEGIAAAERQLLRYQDRDKLSTLRQMISKWAPPSDHNDTEGYIRQVASETGLDANKPIDMHDPAVAARVINAMTHKEVGHPLDPDMIDRGVERGLAGPPSATASIAPLQVIHLDQRGNYLTSQELPVTAIVPPEPHGGVAPSSGFSNYIKQARASAEIEDRRPTGLNKIINDYLSPANWGRSSTPSDIPKLGD